MSGNWRKAIAVFLILTLAIPGFILNAAYADAESSAELYGVDEDTLGGWIGRYGGDGYVLFGYGQDLGEGSDDRRDEWVARPDGQIDYDKDIYVKPSYVDEVNGRMYEASPVNCTKFYGTYQYNDWALENPAGGPKVHAGISGNADGYPAREISFILNDGTEHLVTMYLASDGIRDRWITIFDGARNTLIGETKSENWLINKNPGGGMHGVYFTFLISGSFTLKINGNTDPLPSGVFFDPPAADWQTEAVYLGCDTATQGVWYPRYGNDGYILAGYNPAGEGPSPEQGHWSQADAGPQAGSPYPSNDLVLPPGYLTSYEYGQYSKIVYPPLPDGVTNRDVAWPGDPDKTRYTAWLTGDDPLTAAFRLSGEEEHIFTFYASGHQGYANDFTARICDPGGNVIAEQSFSGADYANKSVYVTFAVKGDFIFKAANPGGWFGVAAFFFDAPLSTAPANLTAEAKPGREIGLTWENSGSGNGLILERSVNNINFARIAEITGADTAYTDTNLTPGRTYYYRLREFDGFGYGAASDAASAETASMPSAALMMLSDDITALNGDDVTIYALETFGDTGEPLGGRIVYFKLIGAHTGDGATLGQEIPAAIGYAVTGDDGVAELTFTAVYEGIYEIQAYTEPDDEAELNGAESDKISFTVTAPEDSSAPVILKISDAVKPGGYFTVNGYGLIPDEYLDIVLIPGYGGEAPIYSGPDEQSAVIVQTDPGGLFAVAKLPAAAAPGVYYIKVKNEFGFSLYYKMNAARALFLSDYLISPGVAVEAVGRNFDQKEFGGIASSAVRLVNGPNYYAAQILECHPYNIAFTIADDVPAGEYDVEVSNDGRNWSPVQSGQKLTVTTAGPDPLNLGVAWAKDFNWANAIDVTACGAAGDDAADDTAPVQAAVDLAASNPEGGVVYFPIGNYYIDTITLPSNVVLQGEDEYGVRLYYTGSGGVNFINSIDSADGSFSGVVQKQGVAKMSLTLANPANRPDCFMWLGQGWKGGYGDKTLRTANRIFISEVNINYPTDSDRTSGGRGIGAECIADERLLIQNCDFSGFQAMPYMMGVNGYYILRNNRFEFTTGYVVSLASYFFAENNHLNIVHPELKKESHGIFGRSEAYMAGNLVENAGSSNATNDGEPLCVEVPAGYFNYGKVLAATADTITVAPSRKLTMPALEYGELSVLIAGGRGTGQLRRVNSINGYVIGLDREFEIIPDGTSRFTLIAPNANATFYNNTVVDCAKGIWLFGNSIDGVVAGNTSINSEGIFIWSDRSGSGLVPDYYNRITGNMLTGVSQRTGEGSIGYNTGRSDNNKADTTDVYSTEILDNQIIGAPKPATANGDTEAPPLSGVYCASASYSSQYDGNPGPADSMNTIIDNNTFDGLNPAITLTHSIRGQVVTNNRYTASVPVFINDTGSTDTLEDNNSLNGIAEHYAESVETVYADTYAGVAPVLPADVNVTATDGTVVSESVAWDPINKYQYGQPGVFAVCGKISGTGLHARAVVTVGEAPPEALISVSGPDYAANGPDAAVTYTVSAAYTPKVSGIELEFEVDGDFLASKEFTVTDFNIIGDGNYGSPAYWRNEGNKWIGKITLYNPKGVGGGAVEILGMTFDVKEGAAGETEVKLNYVKLSFEGESVPVNIVNGAVTTYIGKYFSRYDLNKDGVINLNDLTYALKFFMAREGEAGWDMAQAADFNGDGIVDISDLILILANYSIPYYS